MFSIVIVPRLKVASPVLKTHGRFLKVCSIFMCNFVLIWCGVADSPSFADRCEYFSASCSHNLTHCLLQCSGPSLPFSILVAYEEDKFEFGKMTEI